MAETMQFDLVSPERRLASMRVTEVRIPGTDGDLTAMAGHAATITTLRPGLLRAIGPEGERDFAVTGGFAEIAPEGVTVLAERATGAADLDQTTYDSYVSEAREAHRGAQEAGEHGLVADTAKLLADMEALGTHVGLDPNRSNFGN